MTDVTSSTREAAGWLDANWESWIDGTLRIVVIVLLGLVLRTVVRKLIDQLIHRMTREAEHSDTDTSSRLGGLLVNPSGAASGPRR